MRLELKPAHKAAYEENITRICTDRLAVSAQELARHAYSHLPKMSVNVTTLPARYWWGVKKPQYTAMVTAKNWYFSDLSSVGRKGRRLVLQAYLHEWEFNHKDAGREYEDPHILGYWDPHTFSTDLEIFPLTPQQAAFVGTRHLDPDVNIFWGTLEDVRQIESKFPISFAIK